MKKLFDDVKAFHEKNGLGYSGKPQGLPIGLARFRYAFMKEEAEEWHTAQVAICEVLNEKPTDSTEVAYQLAEALDAIIDQLYVVMGNAYLQGFTSDVLERAWDRVQAANMQKIRQPSQRSQEYDIVKPPGWEAPVLIDLVEDHSHKGQS